MALAFYAGSEWIYRQDNLDKVWSEMSSLDRKLLNFDMSNFPWEDYHSRTIRAICAYLLKEDFSDLSNTRKRYFR